MSSNMWKVVELKVAKYFNTERRNRGNDFSQSDCEIRANIATWLDDKTIQGEIIAECKYRTGGLGIIPTFIEMKNSKKVSIGFLGKDIIITPLDTFQKVFLLIIKRGGIPLIELSAFEVFQVKPQCPKYVNEYISQARQYIPKTAVNDPGIIPSLPILCCAKRGSKGLYAVFSIMDVKSFRKTANNNRIR